MGSQQNRDYVHVRKSFKDQRGTLTISSGLVAGVSRRIAAGVPLIVEEGEKGTSREKLGEK